MVMVHRRLARTAILVVALLAPLVSTPDGVAEPQAPPGDTPPRLITDLSGPVAAALGISPAEAARRLEAQAAGSARDIAALERAADDAYAGVYFDDTGTLVIAVASDAAADAVRAAGAAARVVKHTKAELTEVRDALDKYSGVPGTSWGLDFRGNRVVITLAGNVNATAAQPMLDAAAGFGDAVAVEWVDGELRSTADILGGFPIDSNIGRGCSAGFNVLYTGATRGVLTAGHCTQGLPFWNGLGPSVASNFAPPGPTPDFGLIRNDQANPLPGIYLWNGTYVQVSRAGNASGGMATCHSGRTTGSVFGGALCGTVVAIGVTVTLGDGTTITGMDQTNFCSLPGDSGGSHFANANPTSALGMLSASTSIGGTQCPAQPRSCLQPANQALNTYGARIFTGNSANFLGQSVPGTLSPGQTATVSVSMQNNGSSFWLPGQHKLGSQNPADNQTWGLNRVNVAGQVAPGATATFSFTIRAPSTPGTYNFQWRMLEEGVESFGALSPNVTITVPNPATPCVGAIDSVDRYGVVTGWGRDPGSPSVAINVELRVDGALVGTVRADRAHPAQGNHGFRFVLSRSLPDGPHSITATGLDVTGDPPAQLGSAVPFTWRRLAAAADFDGDFRGDVSVWWDSDGTWYSIPSGSSGFVAVPFGLSGDRITPGDYDGDRITDHAVFRPGTGVWWILRSGDGAVSTLPFGLSTDEPVAADYTGDGKTDVAVWREADGTWYIQPSEGGSYYGVPFGQSGDRPVPGDYDGDGRTDVAVFRPPAGQWIVLPSSGGPERYLSWGTAGDRPVPADYDGDTDIAVFRPSDGTWWIADQGVRAHFGTTGDQPVARAYLPA
jgi:hypothetical protein